MPSDHERLRAALVKEAKRLEEDTTYSARSQFEAARIWNFWGKFIGLPTTAAAAASGASAFADNAIAATILAALAAIGSAFLTFLKPHEVASRHLAAGNAFDSIRTAARAFHEIDCLAIDDTDSLRQALSVLTDRKNEKNAEAPNPPRRAYNRAKKGIEHGEARHLVDAHPTYQTDEAEAGTPR